MNSGSPPRVWGRPRRQGDQRPAVRFTPTCVGKAAASASHFNHVGGSPPRVWGRRRPLHIMRTHRSVHPHVCGEGVQPAEFPFPIPRFTPTCVGKAVAGQIEGEMSTVHPHVCGEGGVTWNAIAHWTRFTPTCVGKAPVCPPIVSPLFGSPPRVWGRPEPLWSTRPGCRFTPTCVGKAARTARRRCRHPVHPHVCGEGTFRWHASPGNPGSPPRVWGRRGEGASDVRLPRFTPTCVGKACSPSCCWRSCPVHPHVCGEGPTRLTTAAALAGSPPRVWGRRRYGKCLDVHRRFTPTCVGKAWSSPASTPGTPVHPHVCGEGGPEPPQADEPDRFTPTCVGKATARPPPCPRPSVHPHVCGEGVRPRRHRQAAPLRFTPTCVGKARTPTANDWPTSGSPPRVWGRRRAAVYASRNHSVHPHVCGEGAIAPGTPHRRARFTPTCVGKAPASVATATGWWVHPHVCGEGDTKSPRRPVLPGSPPRVWGRPCRATRSRPAPRFTPTCVGKATGWPGPWPATPVHPHVCGEGAFLRIVASASGGSPPRVWGRLYLSGKIGQKRRFTPTCVGKAP